MRVFLKEQSVWTLPLWNMFHIKHTLEQYEEALHLVEDEEALHDKVCLYMLLKRQLYGLGMKNSVSLKIHLVELNSILKKLQDIDVK